MVDLFAGPAATIVRRAAAPAGPWKTAHAQSGPAPVRAGWNWEMRPVGQTTLAAPIALSGRGLHTGRHSRVRIEPAPAGSGIRFRRLVDGEAPEVGALWRAYRAEPLCSALSLGGGRIVRTVEHLLAALSALAIDNATVELAGEELPIFDGSAAPWCEAILAAGRRELAAPRTYLEVLRPVEVEQSGRRMRIEPADTFRLDVTMCLRSFGEMRWRGEVTPGRFLSDLAPSRSFGRLKWALPTKFYALACRRPVLRGAGPGNVAAIWGGRVLGGMRVPDEPVRHRALDIVGDLAMAGRPILGLVTAERTGHELNHALLRALMSDESAYRYVTG